MFGLITGSSRHGYRLDFSTMSENKFTFVRPLDAKWIGLPERCVRPQCIDRRKVIYIQCLQSGKYPLLYPLYCSIHSSHSSVKGNVYLKNK